MSLPRSAIFLAPSVNTTTVTTTTTTTTTYQPIEIPPLPQPSSPKDPKQYPLLEATLPKHLSKFPIEFPNGTRATFRANPHQPQPDSENVSDSESEVGGNGWRMLKRDHSHPQSGAIDFEDAIDRYTRKRSLSIPATNSKSADIVMDDVDSNPVKVPPRKKVRGSTLDLNRASQQTGPLSPLPSPGGSPPPENIWGDGSLDGGQLPTEAPVQPNLSLVTLMTLPNLVNHFTALPPALQSHVLLSLMRRSTLPVIRTVYSVVAPTMTRDFLSLLPPELSTQVLSYLPIAALGRASRVCKSWRNLIDSEAHVWSEKLKLSNLWFGGVTEEAFVLAVRARRHRLSLPAPSHLPLPHPFKVLFRSRHLTRSRWIQNRTPRQISFPAHGNAVVTCLLFSHGRIISASDDHSIQVFDPKDGRLLNTLQGHSGGVWALAAARKTLVSGSTDRTVRIWDLETGRCKHVFGGHSSTVRCLSIVKPEWIDITLPDGHIVSEKWPKRPLIVTGSRDHTLRVWDLPGEDDREYRCFGADEAEGDPADEDVEENPYHKLLLSGHDHAVRALAARGRTLISGSYDCSVRVWDVITGALKWVLTGHTQKVYSVVYDPIRNQASSGSMDGTVRIWDLQTGQCKHLLNGHTSLVGLLGHSPNRLVSAAADATLRVWNPDTGENQHTLAAHTGAITCFQHDEFKILSGSDGNLKMWDIRDGTVCRDLLTGVNGVWQVVFEGQWCVAASSRPDATYLDVWDFGKDDDDDPEGWLGEADGSLYDEDFDGEFERRQLMHEEEEEEEAVAMDLEMEDREGKQMASQESIAHPTPAQSESPSPAHWDTQREGGQESWVTPTRPQGHSVPSGSPSRPNMHHLRRQMTTDAGTPSRPRSRLASGGGGPGPSK